MAEKQPTSRDEQIQEIELELKKVQLAAARAQLQDTQEGLQLREMQRAKLRRDQQDRAAQLADEARFQKARALACPHKKGGTDLAGYFRGTDDKYAVIRFQLPNADYLMKCSRCPTVILPPVEPLRVVLAELCDLARYGYKAPAEAGFFAKDDRGGFGAAMKLYREGIKTYNLWLQFPTDNVASTACLPGQTGGDFDWKRYYRLAVHETLQIPIFQAERWPKVEEEGDKLATAS